MGFKWKTAKTTDLQIDWWSIQRKISCICNWLLSFRWEKYPETSVEDALKFKEEGFTAMKLKVGFTPEKDIEYIRSIRKAVGPDVRLMVDFNACYSQAVARRIILELVPENIYFYEEILTPEDMEGYKALRNLTASYMAAGEEIFGKIEINNWLKNGALDIYQPDVSSAGGITECKKWLQLHRHIILLLCHMHGDQACHLPLHYSLYLLYHILQ